MKLNKDYRKWLTMIRRGGTYIGQDVFRNLAKQVTFSQSPRKKT